MYRTGYWCWRMICCLQVHCSVKAGIVDICKIMGDFVGIIESIGTLGNIYIVIEGTVVKLDWEGH